MGFLTREQMEAVIDQGGSVLVGGQVITDKGALPGPAQVAERQAQVVEASKAAPADSPASVAPTPGETAMEAPSEKTAKK